MSCFFGLSPAFLFCMNRTPAALLSEPWCKLDGIEASGGRGPSTVSSIMDDSERRALARAHATARPIGAYTARALDPAARARGFATAALLAEWPSIVGAELAQFTMPDRVVWPRHRDDTGETVRHQGRRDEGAILILRVDGPRAIEVQHRSCQILERVNGHFGYRAVAEMRILQAPVTRKPAPAAPAAPQPIDPDALPPSAAIEDAGLREALLRLASAGPHRR
jgi:hypothetical protein